MPCTWCGVFNADATPGWDDITYVCSQRCQELMKQALGKEIGMGKGTPHAYVPPADPSKWGDVDSARAARAERSRAAGQRSAAARLSRRESANVTLSG